MSAFTDEDLKRLKNMFASNTKGRISWDGEKWIALIARLEAAEDALSSFEQGTPFIHNSDLERWRKAAGKE